MACLAVEHRELIHDADRGADVAALGVLGDQCQIGATEPEVAESIFVAMALRAGGSFAHSTVAMNCLEHQ